MIEYIYWFDG